MRGGRRGRRLRRPGPAIEAVCAHGCETLVRTGPEREGPLAGRFEPLGPVAFPQAPAPSTGPEALLRMGPCGENGVDHLGRGGAAVRGPPAQPLWGPRGRGPVCSGPVGCHSAVAALEGRTLVAGDACALVEAFHPLGTAAHLKRLRDPGRGHRVLVPVDLHVGVDGHASPLPLRVCIGLGGERLEGWAVQGVAPTLA
jgi:hypothetical protein